MDTILSDNSNDICDTSDLAFLPIQHNNLISYYHEQKNVFWVPDEIDLSNDRTQFDTLNDDTKYFIKNILAFFAQADGLVIENIMERFQKDTMHIKEARAFYCMQNCIEMIHSEMYSLLIDVLIRDLDEKKKTLDAISYYPCIKTIARWAIRWMNSDLPLSKRIIAFACIEGVLFSGAFCSIYWIKRQNLLEGVTKANEFIARDEAIHCRFAVALYRCLTDERKEFDRLSEQEVFDIVDSCIQVTNCFITDALRPTLVGIDSESMIRYVKCTADNLLVSLGYSKLYNFDNPFIWMNLIGLSNKSNFFETKVTEYSKVQDSDFEFKILKDY
jgi:ribonucleotide reductase beta subunit family protein with ferritin-like domain